MTRKTIQHLIQQGKIQEAILALKEFVPDTKARDTLSIIEAEYNGLHSDVLNGTIDFEQKQIRTNRINEKLLKLLGQQPMEEGRGKSRSGNILILIPLLLVAAAFFYFKLPFVNDKSCPDFKEIVTNKILLIPFENVGGQVAKPHLILRDRIEALTLKNDLSTSIQLGEEQEGLMMKEAPKLAEQCGANVIIWGKYSNATDSIRLILQYHFLEFPDWSKMNELIVLKDVTSIQQGKMLNNLDDAIYSLCSVIAIRQNKKEVAKNWLEKIEHPNEVDELIAAAFE